MSRLKISLKQMCEDWKWSNENYEYGAPVTEEDKKTISKLETLSSELDLLFAEAKKLAEENGFQYAWNQHIAGKVGYDGVWYNSSIGC